MLCSVTEVRWVMVESSDKTWSTGEGDGKPLQILALRTPQGVWKGKMIWNWNMSTSPPPRSVGVRYAMGKSGEIATERMKRLSQSGNRTQLWMFQVENVKSDAVKNNIAQKPEMLGPRVKEKSVQFSWIAQSYPTPCHPMDCSMPGFPLHHQHPELPQTHVHGVSAAIQPSHPPSSPSSLPSIVLSIRVFSNESVFCIRGP